MLTVKSYCGYELGDFRIVAAPLEHLHVADWSDARWQLARTTLRGPGLASGV
jgi:hypothetical protein